MANIIRVIQDCELKWSTPNRKPAIDENTTLMANPALVISLKSKKVALIEKESFVASKAFFNIIIPFS